MRDDLRCAPVHGGVSGPARQHVRSEAGRAHLLGRQRDFELNGERAAVTIRWIVQIRQGLGVAMRSRRHRFAKRRKRLRTDDPRTDAGQEILRQERSQRLVLPRLQVARRPVVEQAIAGDMLARFSDRDRLSELIALADPDAELQLIIEPAAWPIFRSIRVRRFALAAGADHGLARGAHRTRPAVIADRHIFVVRKQRIVGPELLADVGRVMNADVEIGVVADEAGDMKSDLALTDKLRLDVVPISLVAQELAQGGGEARAAPRGRARAMR